MAKDREEFNIPENAAWALLICIVGFFAIATGVQFIMTVEKNMLFRSLIRPSDIFLSARQQAGWYAIGISFMASGLGAWIIYGTTELGATRPISWWGVLGYSTASAMPAILICFLGPLIRKKVGAEKGFSATDFALSRYGRLMHLQVSAISCFYMYIYLVAELTTIGNVYATMIGKDITGTESESYTTRIAIALIVATWAYTALGGLPASIFTDKFQGIIIAAVVTMLLFATTTVKRNRVSRSEFNDGTGWFSKGFEVLVTLWIAILSAEMFNQGTWQRVFAAKSDKDMRLGFAFGALLVCIIMLFFGIMGMLAYSNDRESYDTFQKLAYLSFFDLLLPLDRTWHFLFLALLTTLAASSVDTLQNGLAAVLSQDLVKHHLSANWSRLIVIGFNIAAVIQAAERFEVVPLFLVADLVCATSVFPLFLGLIQHDIPIFSGRFFIPAPTELGAFLGCLSGLAAVIINGRINDVHRAVNFYTGKVYERNPNLAYFWLTNTKADGTPYECALCGSKTMHTFIAVPLIAAAATFFFLQA
uniref:Sodium/solute symporter n=1 Tax=Aureoumbra lagunensis TaxID=44058 RepID=A0A7S3JQI4_9STRA